MTSNQIPIDLKSLNTSNYLNFVFNHQEITREQKKKQVFHFMEVREKTISNYRFWIDVIFNKTEYWKRPTLEEIEYFDYWKTLAFNRDNDLFNSYLSRTPKVKADLIKEFEDAVYEELTTIYNVTFSAFMNGLLPKDFYLLANVIGKVEFIQSLYAKKNKIEDNEITPKYYALWYWIELQANGKKPPRNGSDLLIKSKIKEEGRLRMGEGKSDEVFYKVVKNLSQENRITLFNLNQEYHNWKEIIQKISNYDTKVIKHIEKMEREG